jgi:hypothetical protein
MLRRRVSCFSIKGINYKRTDLLPVVSWVVLKALRFPDKTVPAAKIDGERVQGTRAIARELERRQPQPPLFPSDTERRRVVEEAERFGDEELQQRVREIFLWPVRKERSGLVGYLEGGKIGMPHGIAARTAGPFIAPDAAPAEPSTTTCARRVLPSRDAPTNRRLDGGRHPRVAFTVLGDRAVAIDVFNDPQLVAKLDTGGITA